LRLGSESSTSRGLETSGGGPSAPHQGALTGSSTTGNRTLAIQVPDYAVKKTPCTAFRFDVGFREEVSPVCAAPSLARQCEGSVDERGRASGPHPTSVASSRQAQAQGAGHHELRFHGSSLYKNAMLRGHGSRPMLGLLGGHLAAVQE
jgi:hypothetical protein